LQAIDSGASTFRSMATLTASSSSKGLTYLCSLLVRSVNVSLSSSLFNTFFYIEKSFSIGALVTE
jgi:hypothetical protein